MRKTFLRAMLAAGLAILPLASIAGASEMNQLTRFTFNQPVELPGMVLSPGTYVFRVPFNASEHNLVEVWNNNQTHLIGTFLTITEERGNPSDHPTLHMEERAARAPMAVGDWFYPGRVLGHEFIYPATRG